MTAPARLDPESLPRPAERAVAVRVRPAAERALRSGHPWLFEESITSISRQADPGDVAVVFDRRPLRHVPYDTGVGGVYRRTNSPSLPLETMTVPLSK